MTDFFNHMMDAMTGDSGKGYHCNKCKYEVDKIIVQTLGGEPRKLFYCTNKRCHHFGLIKVVAIVKNKK